MRALVLFILAGLFALACFWIGYRVGSDTWYSAGYREGYSRGTHDVCARLATFDQQLTQDIKSTPNLDPSKAQLFVTLVAEMRSQSCSQ